MNLKNIAITVLLFLAIGLGIFCFFQYRKIKKNEYKSNITEKKIDSLQKEKDSIIDIYDQSIKKHLRKFDSLKSVKQQIRYIPYEKSYYYDRTLDAALDTIANYRYQP